MMLHVCYTIHSKETLGTPETFSKNMISNSTSSPHMTLCTHTTVQDHASFGLCAEKVHFWAHKALAMELNHSLHLGRFSMSEKPSFAKTMGRQAPSYMAHSLKTDFACARVSIFIQINLHLQQKHHQQSNAESQ